MRRRSLVAVAAALAALCGCVSVDDEAFAARQQLAAGNPAAARAWSEKLANDSAYSKNLGLVEAGRVSMLAGDYAAAERSFRAAVDSAVDRKERSPRIKLGDLGNLALSSTVTDDRTMQYYLSPYEINLALGYGIVMQAVNGKRDDALADARLAVYLQDSLASTYGADVKSSRDQAGEAAGQVYGEQSAALQDVMAGTRNSWENPVLWYLTGVLFEADGDLEMAWQSYRKAKGVQEGNALFAASVQRADAARRTPEPGKAKLVIVYEEGIVPMRESFKIPVPVYTAMTIDIPRYPQGLAPYAPNRVSISGADALVAATPSLDVRALACRDLDEHLPGVIARNISRALVQAGAQTAVNCATGNGYARLAMFAANAVVSAMRRADTRSWISLPDGQQLWEDGAMAPGTYRLGLGVNGRTVQIPVTLAAGETRLVWIADCGGCVRSAEAKL